MKFDLYLKNQKSAADMARVLGVTPVLISQWRHEDRPVPIERCPAIEAATNGAVMRWDLRPDDWHLIWPELRTRPDAPPISSKQAA